MYWNFWLEDGSIGPQFKPVPYSAPGSDCQLIVDLATLRYGPAVRFREASSTLADTLTKWVRDTTEPTLTVKTVLLVGDLFEPAVQIVKDLTINLDKLRRSNPAAASDADPLSTLRSVRDPAFFLGRVSFGIKTRAQALGMTSVGLSIWVQGIPVDQLSFPMCVATEATKETCDEIAPVTTTLNGVDSFRLAHEGVAAPDAALHFVDLDGNGIRGVFHVTSCPDCPFLTWSLKDHSFAELHDHLVKTTLAAFQEGATDAQRIRVGASLYNVLFPAGTVDGDKARLAFDQFVQGPPPPARGGEMPSIFIRMIGRDAHLALVPFGMTVVQVANGVDFLANRFRVEMPLAVQSYAAGARPVSRWFVALPSASRSDELGDARKRAGAAVDAWTRDATIPFPDMSTASDWISKRQTEPAGSAFVTLSHHDDDRLFFDSGDQLSADDIGRTFARPAVAILDGCGTGVAAGKLIGNLNDAGVSAVIATATPVSGQMAGDFLACLAGTLDRNRDVPRFTLSQAYRDVVVCLRDDKQYGARAMTWLLLGNGSLQLRSPRKEQ